MLDLTLEGMNFKRLMREKGIHERVGRWVERVTATNHGVEIALYDHYRDGSRRTSQPQKGVFPRRLGDATETLDCDTVILCTARELSTALYDDLVARRASFEASGIEMVVRSGDCLAPRYLADAIFDGHRIAREFESPNPERPLAIIRERQIFGHEVFPKLGDRVL